MPRLIRKATEEDLAQRRALEEEENRALEICRERIAAHGLPMRLITSHYTLDRRRLTFYFSADGRVDFRALVRDLARIFKCRIELRQVGVRDYAKLIGGVGVCGRPLCCATFLHAYAPISMRMAKEQGMA
ncbi:MAG: stage 0 sporulation protein, partial [Armatimonadetes bacterium]|nr:stage 0 sporulation protein [Armatimonadota bacterium]